MLTSDIVLYSISALLCIAILTVIYLIYRQLKPRKTKMRSFIPVETAIQAAQIVSLQVVTTATLDDGSSVIVPNEAVDGAYVIAQDDGSLKLAGQVDFESRYKAA